MLDSPSTDQQSRSQPGDGEGLRFDVFLSHNGSDKPLVELIAERLKQARLEPWFDRWNLVPGRDWPPELAQALAASRSCAVFVGPSDLGAWANQEVQVALDRMAKDPEFRLFLVLLPGLPEQFDTGGVFPFLAMKTWVDFRRGLDDPRAFHELICAVKGLPPGPAVPIELEEDVCPYRGLEVFEEEHAGLFFGREADVQRLLEKLKGTRFLAVLGASGSGKSSLVRAGLIPALKGGALGGDARWQIVVLRPGAHPLEALSVRLVRLNTGLAMQETLDRLTSDPRTLHLAASLALSDCADGTRMLFVVDQFEEVFTLCRDEQERNALFANLLYAAAIPDGSSSVLLTMRADFYHRCAAYPELAQQLAERQYLVSPLQLEGLRQAIAGPARAVGLSFEPGLVATILDDVAEQPGALPLLEHALLELWERRAGAVLTLAGYRDSGGVQGAISKRADEVFESLSPDRQKLARRTFLRLTQPGEGTEDTRRRAQLDELAAGDLEGSLAPVVHRLVDARLLTTSRDDAGGSDVVEVAHEALIRGWPRLRGWVDEDRAGLRVHRRLTEAAQEWERLGRDPGALHRGARLAEALEWRVVNEESLNELEREFLDASGAAEAAARKRARRQTLRLRWLAAALALLFVAAGVAAGLAVRQTRQANTQKNEAQRQNETALSRALAGEAPLHLRNESDLASLLAVEAYRVAKTPEARAALTRLVQATDRISVIRSGDYLGSAFSPSGTILALGDGGGDIRFWDVRRERFVGALVRNLPGPVELLAYSGNGRRLAAVAGTRLIVWDVAPGPRLEHRNVAPFAAEGGSGTLAVDPSGDTIAAATGSERLVLWRLGAPKATPLVSDVGLSAATQFTRDGRTLVVANGCCANGAVERIPIRAGRAGPISVTQFDRDCCLREALSPGAEVLAAETLHQHRTVVVWDVVHAKPIRRYPATAAGGYGMAMSPGGRSLAIGDWNGTVTLYDLAAPAAAPGILRGRRGAINDLAFGRGGGFASVDNRGGVIIRRLGRTLEAAVSSRGLDALVAEETPAVSALRRRLKASPAFRGMKLNGKEVELSPRGTTFVLVDWEHPTVVIGDAHRLVPLQTVRIPGTFGPNIVGYLDDDTFVTGQNDVRFWNPHTGKRTHVFAHSSDTVNSFDATVDGRTLVVGYESGDVAVWDVPHERTRVVLQAHNDFAIVALNRGGRIFASGGREGEVKLWDVASGRELGDPLDANGSVQALFFDTGQTLAVRAESERSGKPVFRAWRSILWRPEAALKHLCHLAGRNLTKDEWRQFVPGRAPSKTCGRWAAPG